ncbi:hypothetical protein DL764_003558 [Monosporascus ibericus]|uniref:Uncharacterized protein n=1 Tax=Monosporascus ibericus TaxID=155417 RepID=A0A4V1XBC7_9PEZI|nr:hypothetical protein DL764_003558 [Monosporascus ibericus]
MAEISISKLPPPPSHLLALPAELREQIYRVILSPAANRVSGPDDYDTYSYGAALALFFVSRQVYYEARATFRALNVFVRVMTPWPEAQDHVELEGHVPILLKGRRAARFVACSLHVAIEAPLMGGIIHHDDDGDDDGGNGNDAAAGGGERHFVILLDDLPKFTRTWFYSELSSPGLNRYLSLRLHLRDPYAPSQEETHVPQALQRQLLLPFGEVKNLSGLLVTGDPAPLPSVEAELRAQQAVAPPGPERCLDEAARLKGEGNARLQADDYAGALDSYGRAWEAMHIVVRGRRRHIHGEAFFARQLSGDGSGAWTGRNGAMERLMLRVQLVANTCLAYLRLGRWDDVCFWGMRSIAMLRQARLTPPLHQQQNNGFARDFDFYDNDDDELDVPPENEAVLGFPGAVQMGKIYYRTAVAYRELGDKARARRLLRVAAVYLPHDANVKRELAACAPRLG